jgi:hypothetical protein
MRTPVKRKRACELYALAQSTPHADEGLVYVLRAMELEAEAGRLRRDQVPKLNISRLRRSAGRRSPAAKRARQA